MEANGDVNNDHELAEPLLHSLDVKGRAEAMARSPASPEGDVSKNFMKGVAISVWQNSGDEGSNWTRYAYSRWPFNWCGLKRYRGKYNIGKGSDFWNRYREDLTAARQIGCTSFRFSIEWARLEPTRGVIDQKAVERYHAMLDVMQELGLEPNATLHHFVHPTWFEDLGAFVKEENIPIFIQWCCTAYRLFGSRIKLWATFNEPTCYLFLGYITGFYPPGRMLALLDAGKVLRNMLMSHVAAYKAIKAMPGGEEAQVGLVHHHITFTATGSGLLYSLASGVADWLTYWWGHDVVHQWMLTGHFEWCLPLLGGGWLKWDCPGGRPPCDWWGINYYSRAMLSWALSPSSLPGQIMSDMYYPIYPEGMYAACMRSAQYGLPIYITETGIADVRDDKRAIMIDAYFKEVLRALGDGADVRGFYYWTLVDNFEWSFGYTMKFGLLAFDPALPEAERKLKEGSKTLVRLYKTLPDRLVDLKKVIAAGVRELGADLGAKKEMDEGGIGNLQQRRDKNRVRVLALG